MSKTKKTEINKEEVEKVKKAVQKDVDLTTVDEMVKNNFSQFEYEKKLYRVRNATFQEKQEAYSRKVERYTELLQDPKNLLEEDLKKLYSKRGIDIDELTKQINTLEIKKANTQFKLGKLLKEKADESLLKALRDEIAEIDASQLEISMKKTNWLQTSIESQVLIYVYQYLTYAVTERKEGDDWVKAWDTYEDFLNSPDTLVNRASFNASLLIGQV